MLGLLGGAGNDSIRLGLFASGMQGKFAIAVVEATSGFNIDASTRFIPSPQSNLGQFGYDLGPALTVVAGGFVGGIKGAASRSTSYLYQKVGPLGEHLKFGITNNPATRYTAEQLAGSRLRILAQG